jgi:prepilin-type N-terminal cleavage/methylation domain-containing protein
MIVSTAARETGIAETATNKAAKGFSLIELIVVISVIVILTAVSIPYIYNYKRLYKSEDQALKVMDMMREAGQLALNRRRIIRFEIDLTDNAMLIIDENSPSTTGDDTLIRSIPLERPFEVRMDTRPATVAAVNQPTPPNYNDATFAPDTTGHKAGGSTISNHSVWAARFRSDGSVVNSFGNPISSNLYLWPPRTPGNSAARSTREVRAITMFGGSGAVRYWKYNGTTFVPYQ